MDPYSAKRSFSPSHAVTGDLKRSPVWLNISVAMLAQERYKIIGCDSLNPVLYEILKKTLMGKPTWNKSMQIHLPKHEMNIM